MALALARKDWAAKAATIKAALPQGRPALGASKARHIVLALLLLAAVIVGVTLTSQTFSDLVQGLVRAVLR